MRRSARPTRLVAALLGLALAVVAGTTCSESSGPPGGGGDDPLIAVSNATVGMTVTQGDPTMRSATVAISNAGGGTLSGLSVSVSYGGGVAGYLTASLNSTTAPATLTLQASGTGMTVGSHPATVTVQSPVATNGSVSISVTCTVTAPATNPAIGLSNTSLAFAAQTTGAEPPVQTVSVTNAGTGSLTGLAAAVSYQSGQPTGWLSASLSATTAPATLTVQASKTGLAAGTYNGTIAVTSSVANNSPQTVAVTFTVTQPPAIGLSETSLSFASVGAGVPAAQPVTVSNVGAGSLTGLGTAIAYGAGQPTGWLSASLDGTTAPATLTVQASPGGLNSGTYQATIDVTSSVASNSPQRILVTYTKSGLTGPSLNVPSVAGTTVQLSWTYGFPPIASSNDGYRLEESTTGPSSGFVQIGSYFTRQTPFVVNLTRGAGTYWYRVRAVTALGTTDYSQVQAATVSSISATRFQNNAAWSVVYLTIDGVQQFSYGEGIPTGYYYQKTLSPGTHSYEARTGTWNPNGTRFEMYWYTGTFNQTSGNIGMVTISNPSIQQLLTRFLTTGRWCGEYWSNLVFHYRCFRFNTNGTFTLSDDNVQIQTGTYSLTNYTAGLVTFQVRYNSGPVYSGTLDEINAYFMMQNGPPDWRTIQYTYQGQ